MKRLLSGALLSLAPLFLATLLMAQQTTVPANPPPVATPDQQVPDQKGHQMPPDVAPPAQTTPTTTADIQKELQAKFDSDPALQSAHVSTVVDDNNITLTGTVADEKQHQAALDLAQTYAQGRHIVDNLKVQGTS